MPAASHLPSAFERTHDVNGGGHLYPMHAEEKADKIEGTIGEGLQFHETYGYYAQGVDSKTACVPVGWKDRLHRFKAALPTGE
jgi:hypothetical protein